MVEHILIRKSTDKQVIGYIEGETYIRDAKRNQQLLEPEAWCIDDGALANIEYHGVKYLEYQVKDEDLIYRVDLHTFRRRGFPVDRGHGAQHGLELKWWKRFSYSTRQEIHDEQDDLQPGLFT